MKKDLTEMVFILDKSGSMHGLEDDTIGGFNSMIERQKTVEGEALVSTVLFSTNSSLIHDRVHIQKVAPLTKETYAVGGGTALMDAVGNTIHHIENIHKYAREEDVPEKTIFVIITDGRENASRYYSSKQVKAMVEEKKEKSGWEFLFLGANIDAVETAARFGIGEDRSVTFVNDAEGQRLNYETISHTVRAMRVERVPLSRSWKKRIEDDYNRRGQNR